MDKIKKTTYKWKQNGIVVTVYIVFVCFVMTTACKSDREYIYSLSSCENKQIIQTFKDEPGFIKCTADPSVDRILYYFFEPLSTNTEFSEQLHFWTTNPKNDAILDKYANKEIVVKISGDVTNCLSHINFFNPDCDCGLTTYEYNILDVSSIKK